MRSRWFARATGLVALTLVIGCSKGGNFATVSGTVTYNGNPVEGATVAFHSTVEVEGKKQASYAALTDSSGKYVIASVGKDPGIPPGLYKVTVTKYEGKAGTVEEGRDPGQLEAAASDLWAAGKAAGPTNLLPREYATVGATKLSSTLETGKNADVNFTLKDAKK